MGGLFQLGSLSLLFLLLEGPAYKTAALPTASFHSFLSLSILLKTEELTVLVLEEEEKERKEGNCRSGEKGKKKGPREKRERERKTLKEKKNDDGENEARAWMADWLFLPSTEAKRLKTCHALPSIRFLLVWGHFPLFFSLFSSFFSSSLVTRAYTVPLS